MGTAAPTDDDDVDGNDDDDDDDDEEDAFFAGINDKDIDQGVDGLLGDGSSNGDDGEYDLNVSFTQTTYLNLWGIFALMLLLNGMCCFVYYKKKKVNRMRAVNDLEASNMEIVA